MRGLQQLAQSAVLLSWAVLGVALVAARLRQRANGVGSTARRDLQSWGGIALQAVGIGLAWSKADRLPFSPELSPELSTDLQAALAFLVMALALASATFAVLAIRELGKQWSLTARVLAGHDLVRSGPFARVRHPIYTALLGLLLATGMAFSTAATTALAAAVYLVGTHWRAAREERLLRETFGPSYDDYARQVPRLLPRLMRKRERT